MKTLLLLLFCLYCHADSQFFPTISGKTLSGENFIAPRDFQKPINLVIVAFKHSQQELVNTWVEPLEKLEVSNTDITYYEFPVMSRMSSWKRWMIYNGMRMGISDSKQRTKTVSFHIEKEPFKDQLNIASESSIYIFIVDQKGKVKGTVQGVYTPEKLKSIRTLTKNQ